MSISVQFLWSSIIIITAYSKVMKSPVASGWKRYVRKTWILWILVIESRSLQQTTVGSSMYLSRLRWLENWTSVTREAVCICLLKFPENSKGTRALACFFCSCSLLEADVKRLQTSECHHSSYKACVLPAYLLELHYCMSHKNMFIWRNIHIYISITTIS